jgi:hypothetical protein
MVSRNYLARWREALGIASFGVVCVLIGATVVLASPDLSAILIALLAVSLAAPIFIRVIQGRFDPFEPIVMFSLAWGAMFVLRPLAMIADNDFSFTYAPALDLHQTFDKMLALALLGAVSFLVGYHSSLGSAMARRAPIPPVNYQPRRVVIAALGVACLGLAGLAVLIHQIGGISQLHAASQGHSAFFELLHRTSLYFAFAPVLLVGATLATFAIGIEQRSWPMLTLALLVGALAWVIFTTGGSRGVLAPLIAGPIIYYYLSRSRRPRGVTLVIGLAAALFLSTAIAARRGDVPTPSRDWGGIAAYEATHPSTITHQLTRGQENSMAPGLAAALQLSPRQIPHTYGWALLQDLVTRPVPRSIWPSKPLPPREELTSKLSISGHANESVNPEFSNLLVFYMDWGMVGVVALAGYGIAVRGLYEWFRIHSKGAPARILFATSIPLLLIVFRDSPVDAFIWALFLLGPIWLVFALGCRRLPNGSRAVGSVGYRTDQLPRRSR